VKPAVFVKLRLDAPVSATVEDDAKAVKLIELLLLIAPIVLLVIFEPASTQYADPRAKL
jgi:hypothetical protein